MRKSSKIRAACVQFNAGSDWKKNLARASIWVEKAARRRVQLLAFPEHFCFRGPARHYPAIALAMPAILEKIRDLARYFHMGILVGSVLEPGPRPHRYYNTSILISGEGKIVGFYRKIHLFDIRLKRGPQAHESEFFLSGKRRVVTPILGIRAGMSICYDLRFPELFREGTLKGCELFFVPSNFTWKTGKAHWEILLKSRAIENQIFIMAPGQSGNHSETQLRSYGHSMIVGPWGETLAEAGTSGERLVEAVLDLKKLRELRRSFPVLKSFETQGSLSALRGIS
ncbi:MAG: carbon-nitrogen hydrolase family protein [Candidatus Omnitrophota bacterium]